jgi:putative holliday junction resolvase
MPENWVLLAFDFGLRRIGVAVGQTITGSANPLPLLLAKRGQPDWEEVAQLIQSWQPNALLVGLPYQMDGSEQALSFAARKFAADLKARFSLPVHLTDERLTSREAKRQLAESGANPRDYPPLDSYAAKLILEAWIRIRF